MCIHSQFHDTSRFTIRIPVSPLPRFPYRSCFFLFSVLSATQDLLLRSLKLLLALPPDVVLPLSNRLASGLLILIQVKVR